MAESHVREATACPQTSLIRFAKDRLECDLTLLMWASGADEKVPEAAAIKVVAYLLDAGAHIDDRNARGRTALMIAAEGAVRRSPVCCLREELILLSRTRRANTCRRSHLFVVAARTASYALNAACALGKDLGRRC